MKKIISLVYSIICILHYYNVSAQKLTMDFRVFGGTPVTTATTISDDASKLFTASMDNWIKIWDTHTGTLTIAFKTPRKIVYGIFSRDGKKIGLVNQDSTVEVYDASTGRLLTTLNNIHVIPSTLRFSPSSRDLAYVSSLKEIEIRDALISSVFIRPRFDNGKINCVDFSPNQRLLLIGEDDSIVRIFDLMTRKQWPFVLKMKSAPIQKVLWSPDGTKLMAMSNNEINIWSIDDISVGDTSISLISLAVAKNQAYVKFSIDGKKLIVVEDTIARIYDMERKSIQSSIIPKRDYFSSAGFCSDGKHLMVAMETDQYVCWDVQTRQPIFTFMAVDSIDYVVYDSLSRFDGTQGGINNIFFRCGFNFVTIDKLRDLLWVPGLGQRLIKGEKINAPTINDLNLCDSRPEVKVYDTTGGEYRFTISPRKGGLLAANVYLNGIQIKKLDRHELLYTNGNYQLTIKKSDVRGYFLSDADNELMVNASSCKPEILSESLILNVGRGDASFMPNLYAVMIGVSDYKGSELDLKSAAKDALDISKALSSSARKLFNVNGKQHVFVYNMVTSNDRDLFPEKRSIQKVLREIGDKATPNDLLLIFFAGHGLVSGPKKQFYFLTADASANSVIEAPEKVGISTDELTEWIKPKNIKAQKRILIFDACYSGQVIQDFVKLGIKSQKYQSTARNEEEEELIRNIQRLNEKAGLFILSASTMSQYAYEMKNFSQGVLTYALLKTLKEQHDILEKGRFLNVSRWFNAAEMMVKIVSKDNDSKQNPQLFANTNFNIGIVDQEVRDKIKLPIQKLIFRASLFMDSITLRDSLNLTSSINKELDYIGNDDSEAGITFIPDDESQGSFTISGTYAYKANSIVANVVLSTGDGKIEVQKFRVSCLLGEIGGLGKRIAEGAVKYAQNSQSVKSVFHSN